MPIAFAGICTHCLSYAFVISVRSSVAGTLPTVKQKCVIPGSRVYDKVTNVSSLSPGSSISLCGLSQLRTGQHGGARCREFGADSALRPGARGRLGSAARPHGSGYHEPSLDSWSTHRNHRPQTSFSIGRCPRTRTTLSEYQNKSSYLAGAL